MRQWRAQMVQGACYVHSGSHGPHQRGRIYRRRKQRQLPEDTFNVQAMTDLIEPIGDGVPITEHLNILRYAEIKQPGDWCRCWSGWGIAGENRNQILKIDDGVAEGVEVPLQFGKGFSRGFAHRRYLAGPRS